MVCFLLRRFSLKCDLRFGGVLRNLLFGIVGMRAVCNLLYGMSGCRWYKVLFYNKNNVDVYVRMYCCCGQMLLTTPLPPTKNVAGSKHSCGSELVRSTRRFLPTLIVIAVVVLEGGGHRPRRRPGRSVARFLIAASLHVFALLID